MKFQLASLEIQKKKGQKEIKEKVKQLTTEKEKARGMWKTVNAAQNEAQRGDALLNDSSAEINLIISKNNEIIEVNDQLKEDL